MTKTPLFKMGRNAPKGNLYSKHPYSGLGGGNSNIFGIFTPILGEDEPILTNIFQMG